MFVNSNSTSEVSAKLVVRIRVPEFPKMEINEITGIIVDEAYKLHLELGPGLLESVYEILLSHRLQKRGLHVLRHTPIPIHLDGISFNEGFRADLVVEEQVLIELKSTKSSAFSAPPRE